MVRTKLRLVTRVASCLCSVFAVAVSAPSRAERETARTEALRDHAVKVPPPITVLPVFSWVIEAGAPSISRRELSIYASGTVVYSVTHQVGRADAGRTPEDEYLRKALPRSVVEPLLRVVKRERLAEFPERFSTKWPRLAGQPNVRATLRSADRTISVRYEPSSQDRSLRAAPAGWSEIEKQVSEVLSRVRRAH